MLFQYLKDEFNRFKEQQVIFHSESLLYPRDITFRLAFQLVEQSMTGGDATVWCSNFIA